MRFTALVTSNVLPSQLSISVSKASRRTIKISSKPLFAFVCVVKLQAEFIKLCFLHALSEHSNTIYYFRQSYIPSLFKPELACFTNSK